MNGLLCAISLQLSFGDSSSISNKSTFTGGSGTSGSIGLFEYENNHRQEWNINSECEQVKIISTHFQTERPYVVTIEGMRYSGNGTVVNQIVGGSFSVIFTSDRMVQHLTTSELGFVLEWSCQPGTSFTLDIFRTT